MNNFFALGPNTQDKTRISKSLKTNFCKNVNIFVSDDFDITNKEKYYKYFIKEFYSNRTAIPFDYFLFFIMSILFLSLQRLLFLQ